MFLLGVLKLGTTDADSAAAPVTITAAALAMTNALTHLLQDIVTPLPLGSFDSGQ